MALGDRLFLEVESESAMHLYVLNEDAMGGRFVLFPLPNLDLDNPLAAGEVHRIPGTATAGSDDLAVDVEKYWEVTSRGGRETLLVIASTKPLVSFEEELAAVPLAGSARAIELDNESSEILLRGVAGVHDEIVEVPGGTTPSLTDLVETVRGSVKNSPVDFWQIVLSNPAE